MWDRGYGVTRAEDRILEMLPFWNQSKEDESAKLMEEKKLREKKGESVLFLKEETRTAKSTTP